MCSNLKVALCALMLISRVMGFSGIGYVDAVDNHQNEGAPVVGRVFTWKDAIILIDENCNLTISSEFTSIGDLAFCRGLLGLRSVTIPDSVESICYGAFKEYPLCTFVVPDEKVEKLLISSGVKKYRITTNNVENEWWIPDENGGITIPGTVERIDNDGFRGIKGLTSVVINGGVKSIGESAFYGCTGLTYIKIPNSVESIGDSAFKECKRLTSITIQNGVKSIGKNAFEGCTELKSITIPSSVTSIGERAFCRCTGLTEITIPDGITSISENAFARCTGLTSITIPNNVEKVGKNAFEGCKRLTSIKIPDRVTSIGAYAFCRCTGLTEITIPDGVTSIGENAFDVCPLCTFVVKNDTVKNLLVKAGVKEYRITANGRKNKWWIPDDSGKITIPKNLERVDNDWFRCIKCLRSVVIEDGVKSIDNSAFDRCIELTKITIPDSVTYIGKSAFKGCTSLECINVYSERVKELVLNSRSLINPSIVHVIDNETVNAQPDLGLCIVN